MSSKWKILKPLACVGVAALVVGACGSSKSGTSTSTSQATAGSSGSTGSTAAPATGSPIKIGAVCTCSGAFAVGDTDIPIIYKAWVASVNAAGGINGHPIDFILKDDAGNPATSASDAQSLLQSDHIIAMVDMTNDDETWAATIEAAKIPVIGSGTSTTPMYTNPDFYPEGQTEDALFPSIIEAAKGDGATNLGLIYCAEAVQCQEGIAPLKATGQKLGLPVTYTAEVSATAPNYTAQCLAAQQAHVTSLFLADITAVDEKVAANCAQQNYHPIYVVDGEVLTPALTSAPGIKDNLAAPVPNLPYFANSPAIQAMNAAVDKYEPGTRTNSAWGELASESWAAGLLFADAAKAGNLGANGSTPTSAELVQGLAALKGDTLDGFASPLTFTPGKANPDDCWFQAVIKNGAYSTPAGLTPQCETSS